MDNEGGACLRCDLIGCISSHHVQNRQSSSRMLIEPRIKLKDIVFKDDDSAALSDEAFDHPPGDNLVAIVRRHFFLRGGGFLDKSDYKNNGVRRWTTVELVVPIR